MAKDKTGRYIIIHDTLEQYSKILDTVNQVADAASAKNTDISLGLSAVASTERELLPVLKQIEESKPKDLDRYEFALTQAIETTSDSLELAQEDLAKRGGDVLKRQQAQKAAEAALTPIEKEGQQADEAKKKAKAAEEKAAEDAHQKRKPPTLLKPGEKRKNRNRTPELACYLLFPTVVAQKKNHRTIPGHLPHEAEPDGRARSTEGVQMRKLIVGLLAFVPLAFSQSQTFTYTYSGLPLPVYPDDWNTVAVTSMFVGRSIQISKVTASVQVQYSGVGDLNVYMYVSRRNSHEIIGTQLRWPREHRYHLR